MTTTATSPIAKAETLHSTSHAFCIAFLSGASPYETLDKYFTSHPTILEHAPSWASQRLPFLGIEFSGRRPPATSHKPEGRTCDDYYDLLSSTLKFHPPDEEAWPRKEDFVVDAERGIVVIKLKGRFESMSTGKGWDEEFVYLLSEFDGEGRIGRQELWADPLSAWQAVGG